MSEPELSVSGGRSPTGTRRDVQLCGAARSNWSSVTLPPAVADLVSQPLRASAMCMISAAVTPRSWMVWCLCARRPRSTRAMPETPGGAMCRGVCSSRLHSLQARSAWRTTRGGSPTLQQAVAPRRRGPATESPGAAARQFGHPPPCGPAAHEPSSMTRRSP